MTIRQISIFVENRRGRLAEITGVLSDNNIDIRALSIADTSDFGILRIIVNNPDKAVGTLKKAGVTVSVTDVLAVRIADEPGGLHSILEVLSGKDIALEYAYAFVTRRDSDAYVILRVENNAEAVDVLTKAGKSFLNPGEIYDL